MKILVTGGYGLLGRSLQKSINGEKNSFGLGRIYLLVVMVFA